jgi:hypothetical protein
MRDFASGATRDSADWKLDLKGFLSSRAIHMLGRYMHFHRKQADGKLRDSDNWKRGIPIPVYEESATRHFFEWLKALEADKEDRLGPNVSANFDQNGAIVAALGLMFNLQGWLHEQAKQGEALGVDLDFLIDSEANEVKLRDLDAAKQAKPTTEVNYSLLQRAAEASAKAEFDRKNPAAALRRTPIYGAPIAGQFMRPFDTADQMPPEFPTTADYVGPGLTHGDHPRESDHPNHVRGKFIPTPADWPDGDDNMADPAIVA